MSLLVDVSQQPDVVWLIPPVDANRIYSGPMAHDYPNTKIRALTPNLVPANCRSLGVRKQMSRDSGNVPTAP